MLIEIIAVSLTALSGIPAITVQTYFWTQQSSPQVVQKPPEQKQEILNEATNAPSQKPTNTPTHEPTDTPSQTEEPEPTTTSTPEPTNIPIPTEIPTPTPEPTTASPTDLESFFTKYADEYHIDKELLKRIAACESGFNTEANFNNLYVGMFQFAEGSWVAIRTRMGLDTNPELRKNAEESIRTAAFHIANGGQSSWPSCK